MARRCPSAAVASLAAGDRVWVHPDLPEKEGARYVLVVAFLRGSVNPPPENWFIKAETWNKKVRDEGLYVTVPEGAQQVLLFLAPETGGDFSTLRNAVRGRPGAFVRASQDLHQASLDRAAAGYVPGRREIRRYERSESCQRSSRSFWRGASISRSINSASTSLPNSRLPAWCRILTAWCSTTGAVRALCRRRRRVAAADMLAQMSYTQQAGSGYYSVYVGTVMDMAKILDSFHTAEYQYLPALAIPKGDTMMLKLNNPPSFHKPQSVLVVGLPAVQTAMRPGSARDACGRSQEHSVRAKEAPGAAGGGAPYVFATSYAHDFVLRVQNKSGQMVDIPVTPDPMQGGFLVNAKALEAQSLAPAV